MRLFFVAAAVHVTFAFAQTTAPVCIIGAGPAGLTIAHGLQAKGLETVIFDKSPEVGGKCQAYDDDQGFFHPMGALLFSNLTYRETLPLVVASGLPSIPFIYSSNWNYDYNTGAVQLSAEPIYNLTTTPLFLAEIKRYTDFWNTEFAPLASVGYKDGVQGYTMSTFDWLLENEYPLLLFLFLEGMTPYGYGDVTQTPILYMLQYLTPDILLCFAGQRLSYVIDFHQVFVIYARDQVKGPIHLNTPVTGIDRSGDYPVVTHDDPSYNGPSTQNCSKLVLAFPPVLHALQAADFDMDEEEMALFSPVGITQYWSGAVQVATPFGDFFTGFLTQTFLGIFSKVLTGLIGSAVAFDEYLPWLPKAGGEPVAFIRFFTESTIASTWSWGKYQSNQTLAEAESLLIEVISKLNKDPANTTATPIPLTETDVKDFRQWDYFPHFDSPQLEQGFYAKFNALQGHRNTYYASGLNAFETVEFAIRAGNDVVDTYF